MRRIVVALVLSAVALAAARVSGPMLQQGSNGPSGAVAQSPDPRIEALRPQMEAAKRAGNLAELKRLGALEQEFLLERQRPYQPAGEFSRPVAQAPARGAGDPPDVVIHPGLVAAHATDWEMDGTMWVATSSAGDSLVHIYKSTDHGQSWIYYWGFYTIPAATLSQLELVVGEGDSGFVYTFYTHPNDGGDLRVVRMGRDTTGYWDFPILAGPDTVTGFSACRDYSGDDYWLYATSHNALRPGSTPPSFIFRSTGYGRTWAQVAGFSNLARPVLQAGAGSYIYQSAVPSQSYWPGWVAFVYSDNYGATGSWFADDFRGDTSDVFDATVAPAFTEPDSEAVLWTAYSHRYQGSDDWDALYCYRYGLPDTWRGPMYLAGSSLADEAYLDIRPYTDPGNAWINASYCYIETTGATTLYRKHANAADPENWSAPDQINAGDVGYGLMARPRLCYSPGAPGTGAGCVFISAMWDHLKWNSLWYGAVEEKRENGELRMKRSGATIVRNVLHLPVSSFFALHYLFDMTGRRVTSLRPGENDVRALPRGVYYVRGGAEAATKVILQ
ncbi:hypothetical protein FJY71_03045 [candidate division WOR-3 bacterium]|nr:hypothetical protein [candidate division WOR-3 bacterium]